MLATPIDVGMPPLERKLCVCVCAHVCIVLRVCTWVVPTKPSDIDIWWEALTYKDKKRT